MTALVGCAAVAEWADARVATQSAGVAAGLRALAGLLPDDVLPCGPRGHALVHPDRLARARWVRIGATTVRRNPAREEVLTVSGLGPELVAVRHPTDRSGGTGPDSWWSAGLAWVRLGRSEALLRDCLSHLAGRESGGTRLVDLPVVRRDLAESHVFLLELEELLPRRSEDLLDNGQRRLHQRITLVDRALLRLLGAHGFLADGPGAQPQLSELAAHVYVPAPV